MTPYGFFAGLLQADPRISVSAVARSTQSVSTSPMSAAEAFFLGRYLSNAAASRIAPTTQPLVTLSLSAPLGFFFGRYVSNTISLTAPAAPTSSGTIGVVGTVSPLAFFRGFLLPNIASEPDDLDSSEPGYLIVSGGRGGHQLFPSIIAGESVPVKFDFGPRAGALTTITAIAVNCIVSGTEQDASLTLMGNPATTPSDTTGSARTQVQQWIGGMSADVTYRLECFAKFSDGRTLAAFAHLDCQAP